MKQVDPNDYLEQIRRDNERRQRELLDRKKAEAAARGKEPFDYERLRGMVAQGSLGRMNPDEERALFERLYYVEHADLMTLEAFANELANLGQWWT